MTVAPASASRLVIARESSTSKQTRIGGATPVRPTSTVSMRSRWAALESSSVARPAPKIITRAAPSV